MAKKNSKVMPVPGTQEKTIESKIDSTKLFSKASLSDNPPIYANFAHLSISINEVTIDLCELTRSQSKEEPTLRHLQRVFIPVGVSKGLATALANIITTLENETKITFPNSREKSESDTVEIWK